MEKSNLYTDSIKKGKRTYFFDINKAENGSLYLKVSERKRTDNGFEHHNLFIFEEDVDDFAHAFNISITKLKDFQLNKNPKEKEYKEYNVEKIRKTYQNAYQKWTTEEDKNLEILYCEGKKVKELATIFKRNEGSIISRIKKLELLEKYGN